MANLTKCAMVLRSRTPNHSMRAPSSSTSKERSSRSLYFEGRPYMSESIQRERDDRLDMVGLGEKVDRGNSCQLVA